MDISNGMLSELVHDAEVHVGGRSVPTFINFTINVVEMLFSFLHVLPKRKKSLSILHDVSGIIRPRRMTLLLGPPSSVKTTLLLTLAGKLDSDLKVTGRISYNGHGMEEFVPQKTSTYISQHDLHIPEMTVRETLAFSARCQGVGTRYEMLTELSRREKAANVKPDPDRYLHEALHASFESPRLGLDLKVSNHFQVKECHQKDVLPLLILALLGLRVWEFINPQLLNLFSRVNS